MKIGRLRFFHWRAPESRTWSDFHLRPTQVGAHKSELAGWSQGDLLLDLPLTWVAPSGMDSITESLSRSGVVSLHSEPVTMPLAIICSQTCDIAGDAVGLQHPFVLVAPLVKAADLTGKATAGNATAGFVGYLFPVPVPDEHSRNTTWFADFRMIFPVSKAHLASVSKLPKELDEHTLLRFAETLAYKFRRPALSDALSYELPKSLSSMVKNNLPAERAHFGKVEQIRISVTDGTRIDPSGVQLFIVTTASLTQTEKDLWHKWERDAKEYFRGLGVRIGTTMFTTPQNMTAEEYRITVPIKVEKVGTAIFW
jgi:hypothetical protein